MRTTNLLLRILIASLVVVPTSGAIDTATICAQLGAATGFGVVARQSFTTGVAKGVVPPPDGYGVTVHGSVCAPQESIARATVVADGASPGDVVATKVKSTGVKLAKYSKVDTVPTHTSIAGSIVTGGATVKTSPLEPPADTAGIDVSGTNPLVSSCAQAQLDIASASDYFAALPPTQTFGTLFLAPATTTAITVAAGDVVDIDYVQIQGPKYTKTTDCTATPGARLDIVGEGPAVINVIMIHPGACGSLTSEATGGPIIINYKGTGRTPVFHGGQNFVGILAPQRTVNVAGTGDANPIHVGYIFGRTVKAGGRVDLGGTICP